jgi:hypothetical protein
MKACPFCAEDIQDAAIVCKHCQRELVAPVVQKARKNRRGLFWVVGILGVMGACYFITDHQRFVEWQARRDQWHARCDQYRQMPLTNPAAENCNRELNAMVAEARANGWAATK